MRSLVPILLLIVDLAAASQTGARFKAFGTRNELPDDDLQASETGKPAYDGNLDLRLMFQRDLGAWELTAAHSTIALAGDGFEFNRGRARGALDQTPVDDDQRALELTWSLVNEDDYRVYHRFDRLALKYRADSWGLTLGREAVSWGSGKAFNPMDLFTPFAPTTVDRDYKAGEDLLLFDKLFANGSDVQALAVFRRDERGNHERDAGSYGVKWRSFLGSSEVELALGEHYSERVAALTFRLPLGGALLQTDWVTTELDDEHSWKVSGVVNIDYSLALAGKTAYVFAEYYRNGFGRNQDPVALTELPSALVERLSRGEVFGLMKDYLALGGSYQWHALLSQSTTVLWNLHDNSSLLQTNVSYEPGDHQRLEAGLTLTMGDRGQEYGRIDVVDGLTSGGGSRFFVRWVYFW